MLGLLGTINGIICDCHSHLLNVNECSMGVHEVDMTIRLHTINKFVEDKVFFQDDKYVIVLDGVVFNKTKIQNNHSWLNTLINFYEKQGKCWFRDLRGSFSGLFCDKKEQKLYLFVDHISDKPIFYYQSNKSFYFASEQISLANLLRENKVSYHLNTKAAYTMLTYGGLLEDMSYIDGAHKLMPGSYLVYDLQTRSVQVEFYHNFKYNPNKAQTREYALQQMHALFMQSIKQQLDKNSEYGYVDYSALSAGLDSRLTTCSIADYTDDFVTFTYAPIGQYDQVSSLEIAKLLKPSTTIFQSSNNGGLLLDVDNVVRINDGLFTYYGTSVLLDYFRRINTQDIGIIHSGQLGDAVFGALIQDLNYANISINKMNVFSSHFIDKLSNVGLNIKELTEKYNDIEMFSLYNRGMGGVIYGANKAFQSFAETFSPFYDVDLWDYCLTIPREWRIKHRLYDEYFLKYHKKYAFIPHNRYRIIGREIYNNFNEFIQKVLKKIRKYVGCYHNRENVTPLQDWMKVPSVETYLNNYFESNIGCVNGVSEELKKDMEYLYINGNELEKNMTLTLLSVIKQMFPINV